MLIESIYRVLYEFFSRSGWWWFSFRILQWIVALRRNLHSCLKTTHLIKVVNPMKKCLIPSSRKPTIFKEWIIKMIHTSNESSKHPSKNSGCNNEDPFILSSWFRRDVIIYYAYLVERLYLQVFFFIARHTYRQWRDTGWEVVFFCSIILFRSSKQYIICCILTKRYIILLYSSTTV